MPHSFVEDSDIRVVFGPGSEARVADHLRDLGARRVLLVALPHHREGADRIATALGDHSVGVFDELQQHVPEHLVTRAVARARASRADWVLAHGGGTTTGFAKAIALSEDVRVAAVPTTYSGSEGTSIWGLTNDTGKRTGRDPRVRPSLVVYDPELTVGLPLQISLQSLLNALAHAVGLLWQTQEGAPADRAVQAVQHIFAAIPALAADPADLEARSEALYGAYLASAMIEQVPLQLHHLLAHVLGGSYGVEHASAHTAVLPYSMAYNALAVPAAIDLLRPVLGDDPPARLHDLARSLALPHSLKGLGLAHADLPRFVELALHRPYPNPRPYDSASLSLLLDDAWHGRRPSLQSRRTRLGGTGPHAALTATERGAPLAEARAVLVAVHGRGATADGIARDFEALLDDTDGLCILAPQALDNTWYPKGFAAPLADNQPFLDSALSMVDAAFEAAAAVVPPERIVVAGFSQGACLALAWARRGTRRPGALVACSGAQLDLEGDYANLADSFVSLTKSESDPWIPPERFERTRSDLPEHTQVQVQPGGDHRLYDADGQALRAAVAKALG